jgi:integrase
MKTTAACWGRSCFFLREMGWLDDNLAPDQLLTPERLRAYLAHLEEHNRPATVLHRMIGLERALAVLAPHSNRSLLRLIIANLEADYEPASKRERLQEVAALVELGFDLMKRAVEADGAVRRRRAAAFRDGLQIALLAMRPLRLKNFAGIRIGRHLVRAGAGWKLEFSADEMKNRRPIDPDVPAQLVPALDAYLTTYRKDLVDGKCVGNALWLSMWWRPESETAIRHQIKRRTEAAFGLPITPHLFRDCAATSLAVHAPEEVQIAHLILGNTYAVMEKHYNLARVVEAGRHYHAALERLRAG